MINNVTNKNTQSFIPTLLVGYNTVKIEGDELEKNEALRKELHALRQGNLYVCMQDNHVSKVI